MPIDPQLVSDEVHIFRIEEWQYAAIVSSDLETRIETEHFPLMQKRRDQSDGGEELATRATIALITGNDHPIQRSNQ